MSINSKSQTGSKAIAKGTLNGSEGKTRLHQVRFLPLLILAMLVNILSQSVHETGHHLVYQIMGHDPVWGFTKVVQVWDTPPKNPDAWIEITGPAGEQGWLKLSSPIEGMVENVIATGGGPLAGLLGAVLGLVISRRSRQTRWKQIGLTFALASSLVAVLYYLRSPIRTGGDEYDIALQLGIAKSFIELPLAVAFIGCLILGLRELPSWRVQLKWLGTILLGTILTGMPMALADPIVIAQVDAGNPWFQPVIGYSLPVFIVIVSTFFGIWVWSRWQERTKQLESLGA